MPNGKLTYQRGEIWWVDLNPVLGSETGKERPCLILQNNIGNKNAPTTIVAPLLPGTRTFLFVVNVKPTEQNGLDCDRHINFIQMRAVDSQRVKNRQGRVEDHCWAAIEIAIAIELGFSSAFRSS